MSTLLRVRHLSKNYDPGPLALRDLSFDVERGEFLVIIGLSGSGKSTLLRCLNHLVVPDGGSVTFDGEPLDVRNPKILRARRRRMAMIFQHYNLVPRTTALDNVLAGRLAERSWWRTLFKLHPPAAVAEARASLKAVGLEAQADRRTERLSGGQRQRVAIARALHQRPDLILADEPIASLDPATSRAVMTYLRDANRREGLTIICNLHDLTLAREFADRVIALRAGEIVYDGRPTALDEDWFKRIYGDVAGE